MRFPGQYYDEETGLYYNYFRYYDPALGRYITSDPIGLAGGLNTYGYVENNSLRWADKNGLFIDGIPPIAWPYVQSEFYALRSAFEVVSNCLIYFVVNELRSILVVPVFAEAGGEIVDVAFGKSIGNYSRIVTKFYGGPIGTFMNYIDFLKCAKDGQPSDQFQPQSCATE